MNKKGFTLVEILAVIIILGIIMVVVGTKGFGAFDKTKKKIEVETVNEIVMSAKVFMTDIEICDDDIDSDLINYFNDLYGIDNCDDLKEKTKENFSIKLKDLIKLGYISGNNVTELYKKDNEFEIKLRYENDKLKIALNDDIELIIQNGYENPFSDDTLSYQILDNSNNSTNETDIELSNKTILIHDGSIESKVGNEVTAYEYGKTNPTVYPKTYKILLSLYIAYACDYSINDEGKFTLGTADCPVQTVKYSNKNEVINSIKGKYAVWGYSSTVTTNNVSNLYKITENESEFASKQFNYMNVNKYVSTEKIIAASEDDYGTSYYYRGGVENNYVNFAGMCWRIVRIQGDSSIKLVLEDQDQLCSTSMDGNWDIGNGNFGYTLSNSQYKMNYLNHDGMAENYDKSIGAAFKSFQINKLENYLKYLKSGDWCFVDTAYSSMTATSSLTEQEKLSLQNSYSLYYYESAKRLFKYPNIEPTLKCNGQKMDKWGDNVTPMYVGTLTADEILYAGANIKNTPNYTYYLINDYQRGNEINWWSFSPNKFDGDIDYIFTVENDGAFSSGSEFVYLSRSFRPAVVLKPDLEFISGNGTITEPYVIG